METSLLPASPRAAMRCGLGTPSNTDPSNGQTCHGTPAKSFPLWDLGTLGLEHGRYCGCWGGEGGPRRLHWQVLPLLPGGSRRVR